MSIDRYMKLPFVILAMGQLKIYFSQETSIAGLMELTWVDINSRYLLNPLLPPTWSGLF